MMPFNFELNLIKLVERQTSNYFGICMSFGPSQLAQLIADFKPYYDNTLSAWCIFLSYRRSCDTLADRQIFFFK